MSKRKNNQKPNIVFRDSSTIIALLLSYLCIAAGVIWLNKNTDLTGVGLFISCLFIYGIYVLIFAVPFFTTAKRAVIFRQSRNQTRNALRFASACGGFAFVLGIVLGGLFLLLNRFAGSLLKIGSLGSLLWIVLAFAVPLLFFNSVMTGAFSGFGMRMPFQAWIMITSVFGIIFGILFSNLFGRPGNVNADLLHNTYIHTSFFTAGMAMGFVIGNLISCIFMCVLHKAYCNHIKNGTIEAYGKNSENVVGQIRAFISSLWFPLIRQLIHLLPLIAGVVFYSIKNTLTDYTDTMHPINQLGIFGIEMLLNFLIPLYFTKLIALHFEESLRKSMARQDRYHGGMRLISGIKQYFCFILPVLFFFSVSTSYMTEWYIKTSLDVSFLWIFVLMSLIAFARLSHSFLQGFESGNVHLIGYVAGTAGIVVYFYLILKKMPDMTDVILAGVICYAIICLVNLFFLRRYFVYKKQLLRHLGYPFIAFVIYAVIVFCIFLLKDILTSVGCFVLSFILALVLHSLLLVLSGAVKEHELAEFPQRKLLLLFGKLTGIYS